MRIVIVGTGQAGNQLAITLRQQGFDGEIMLIGEESTPPYQRPPLSKQILLGTMHTDELSFHRADFYDDQAIRLMTARRVSALDGGNKTITLKATAEQEEQTIAWDKLALVTGARVRPLSVLPHVRGTDLMGIHYIRTLADATALKVRFDHIKDLVIIGGGYIGLEVAAAARQCGINVKILERAPRLLARVASPVLADYYEHLHRTHGVHSITDADLQSISGNTDGWVQAVHYRDRANALHTLPADAVVAGIGVMPNQELALQAGIECADAASGGGIVVDAFARTSHPHIVAAGDCTFQPLSLYDCRMRLESVQNAVDQARTAALSLLTDAKTDTRPVKDTVPWFWSDQYDVSLQIAGLAMDYDDTVIRGDRSAHRFAIFYLKAGRLIAVDAVNSPPEYMAGRALIARRAHPAPASLQNPDIPAKDLLTSP